MQSLSQAAIQVNRGGKRFCPKEAGAIHRERMINYRTEFQKSPAPLKAASLKQALPDRGRMTQFHHDSAQLPVAQGVEREQQMLCSRDAEPPERAQLFLEGKWGRGSSCRCLLRKYKWGVNERKHSPLRGWGWFRASITNLSRHRHARGEAPSCR